MAVIVDIHVHLHPFYEHVRLWDHTWRLLSQWRTSPSDLCLLCLMDADDQTGFESLAEGRWPSPEWKIARIGVDVVQLSRGSDRIGVIAGRQLVSCERIEVMTLGRPRGAIRGEPLAKIIERLRDEQRPAILPWAPGKWWGSRGQILNRLLCSGEGLVVADSSLRPRGYPVPALMRRAMALGIPVAAGSDPLCHPSEWIRIGSYVTRLAAPMPVAEAEWSSWLASALMDRSVKRELLGRRPGWVETFLRILRHMRSRRS